MGTAIAVALCSLAWGPAPASADAPAEFGPGSAALQQATEIARGYWSADACGGSFSVAWLPIEGAVNARSGWGNLRSQYDNPELNTGCAITFNSAQRWNWKRFCSILVHEYGHLTGHAHSEDAGNIMNAYYDRPVAQCVVSQPGRGPAPAAQAPVAPNPVDAGVTAASTVAASVTAPESVVASAKQVAARRAARKHRHSQRELRKLRRHRHARRG